MVKLLVSLVYLIVTWALLFRTYKFFKGLFKNQVENANQDISNLQEMKIEKDNRHKNFN